jgi:molybdate transport system regulatory protein
MPEQECVMKVSARNVLSGVIVKIELGSVNAEVHIQLQSAAIVIAAITKESVSQLKLAVDQTVLALIKAPQIILVTQLAGYRLSARNQLTGKIAAIKMGAVNAEVDITLGDGETLVSTVTLDSVSALGLSKGQEVTAVFKAGAVILAAPV